MADEPEQQLEKDHQPKHTRTRFVLVFAILLPVTLCALIAVAYVLGLGSAIGRVLGLSGGEQAWLYIRDVQVSSEIPADEIRVLIDANGTTFVYPGPEEWMRLEFDLPQGGFALPKGHAAYRLSFEILRKDGTRLRANEPLTVRSPSGEQSFEVFRNPCKNPPRTPGGDFVVSFGGVM